MRPSILLSGLFLLSGCEAIQPDRTALLATTSSAVERPRCDACHGYPPRTGAHRFHMASPDRSPESCQSCHASSIRMTGPVFDSVFVDSAGNAFNTRQWPWASFSREGMTYDSLSSALLDSVPMMVRPRQEGEEFPEWMVVPSDRADVPGHANGMVDVVIARNHHMRGAVANWNPRRNSCSSVKCHDNQAAEYFWKEK
ncbi:MAG TPA: hypothetical protein PKY05_06570 [Fibrobacteria bacterium]|nr:hypothetical protein [Fibrobacteria bacterium]